MPMRNAFVIRIGLITGVAAFAAFVMYQRSRGMPAIGENAGSMLSMLRYVLWALAVLATAGAFVIRSRLEQAPRGQRALMLIVGWALGEGVALFGIVQHYVGAPVSSMAVGLITFALVLVLLPIPRDDP